MKDYVIQIKASLATLVIFESFVAPLFLLFLAAAVFRGTGWNGVVVCGALCAVVFIWWRHYELKIDDELLSYRSLLQGRRRVHLSGISRVVRRRLVKSSGLRPPFRLEIYYRVDGDTKQFDINERVFSSSDVMKLENYLGVD